MIKKKIVFMGSGDELFFLMKELKNYSFIIGYITTCSQLIPQNPIYNYCNSNNINVYNQVDDLENLNPDLVIVISYPILIPSNLLNRFKFINMHGALLPKYRGMHGGTWAIINGENIHGFTIHQIDEGIDSGDIYYQNQFSITDNDNVITIREKILNNFKAIAKEIYLKIINDQISPLPQDESKAIYVSKRYKKDGRINWNQSAVNVFNLIRALTPPYTDGAFALYKDKEIYIHSAELYNNVNYISTVGQVVAKIKNRGVLVKCKDCVILIKNISVDGVVFNSFDYFKIVGARLN